jgi:CHASE3 domain sensor protein
MAEMQMMTRLLRRLTWWSLGALLIVSGTVAGFFVLQDRAQQAFMREREIGRIARTTAALATDRETGIRGFQLTHDQKSLVPEIIARAQLPSLLDSLASLTKSDPSSSNNLQAISVALSRWDEDFAEPAIFGEIQGGSMLAGKPQFDRVRAAFQTFLSTSESNVRREAARVKRLEILCTAIVLA